MVAWLEVSLLTKDSLDFESAYDHSRRPMMYRNAICPYPPTLGALQLRRERPSLIFLPSRAKQ